MNLNCSHKSQTPFLMEQVYLILGLFHSHLPDLEFAYQEDKLLDLKLIDTYISCYPVRNSQPAHNLVNNCISIKTLLLLFSFLPVIQLNPLSSSFGSFSCLFLLIFSFALLEQYTSTNLVTKTVLFCHLAILLVRNTLSEIKVLSGYPFLEPLRETLLS